MGLFDGIFAWLTGEIDCDPEIKDGQIKRFKKKMNKELAANTFVSEKSRRNITKDGEVVDTHDFFCFTDDSDKLIN